MAFSSFCTCKAMNLLAYFVLTFITPIKYAKEITVKKGYVKIELYLIRGFMECTPYSNRHSLFTELSYMKWKLSLRKLLQDLFCLNLIVQKRDTIFGNTLFDVSDARIKTHCCVCDNILIQNRCS